MGYKEAVIKSLKSLNLINRNKKVIVVKAKFGPSRETKIPLTINEEMSCLTAAIIGDGHLKKEKLQISLDGFDKDLINEFRDISNKLFNRNFNVTHWTERNKERYCLRIDSKAIYNLFREVFKISSGKKSNIVKAPRYIKESNKSIKSAFLIGIMVTEGGRRKRGFGLSTSSKELWKDLSYLFIDVGFTIKTDRWIHKKYKREYYGISFKKNNLKMLLDKCKNKKIRDILLKCKNFKDNYN